MIKHLLPVLIVCLLPVPVAMSQQIESPETWQEVEAIDRQLGTLTGPVLQPVSIPRTVRGAPIWPRYKQLPPAAQEDFRLISPAPPGPAPAPFPGGSGGSLTPVPSPGGSPPTSGGQSPSPPSTSPPPIAPPPVGPPPIIPPGPPPPGPPPIQTVGP